MSARVAERRLLVALLLGGALVGLVQTTYGPAFPDFEERFQVVPGLLGLVVGAHFLGNLIATAAAPALLVALGFRRALPLGPLLMAVGAFGVAAAPGFVSLLVAAFSIGLGFGLANTLQLVLTGVAFADRRFWAFNLESAAFGLGSMLGPWLVGGLDGVVLPYLVVGLAALAVALVFFGLRTRPPPPDPQAEAGAVPLGFMGLFFLYVGLEASTGHWGAYHLDALGVPGAFWIGLYWGFQTIGRFLLLPFVRRVPEATGFRAAVLAAGFILLTLGVLPAPGPGYAATGFALAPAFPAAMAWVQRAFGAGGRTTSLVLMAAALGGAFFPSAFGVLTTLLGARSVPYGLAALALAVYLAALGLVRRHTTGSGPADRGL